MNQHQSPGTVRFEDLLEQLEETVEQLDSSELTLDEAVTAYERCVALATACSELLDTAELRVSQIGASAPVNRLREVSTPYRTDSFSARRLLLGDDEDDLYDLVDSDEDEEQS